MKIVKLTADGWVLHINIQRSWTKNGVVVGCPSEDEVLDCVVDDRALKGQGFCLILALKRAHDLLFTHDLCYIQQNGCDSNKTSERGKKAVFRRKALVFRVQRREEKAQAIKPCNPL